LGAFIGDAIGGSLEFLDAEKVRKFLPNALVFDFECDKRMNKLNLSPGQVTDDSEMAMCLV